MGVLQQGYHCSSNNRQRHRTSLTGEAQIHIQGPLIITQDISYKRRTNLHTIHRPMIKTQDISHKRRTNPCTTHRPLIKTQDISHKRRTNLYTIHRPMIKTQDISHKRRTNPQTTYKTQDILTREVQIQTQPRDHWPLKEWQYSPAQQVLGLDVHLLPILCHQRACDLVVSGRVVRHGESQQAHDQHAVVVVEWMQLLVMLKRKKERKKGLDFSMTQSMGKWHLFQRNFELQHSPLLSLPPPSPSAGTCYTLGFCNHSYFCFFSPIILQYIPPQSDMLKWGSPSKNSALDNTFHHTHHLPICGSPSKNSAGDNTFHHTNQLPVVLLQRTIL